MAGNYQRIHGASGSFEISLPVSSISALSKLYQGSPRSEAGIIEQDRYCGLERWAIRYERIGNFYFQTRRVSFFPRMMKRCSSFERARRGKAIRDFRFDFDSTGSRQIGSWRGIFIDDDFRANNAALSLFARAN